MPDAFATLRAETASRWLAAAIPEAAIDMTELMPASCRATPKDRLRNSVNDWLQSDRAMRRRHRWRARVVAEMLKAPSRRPRCPLGALTEKGHLEIARAPRREMRAPSHAATAWLAAADARCQVRLIDTPPSTSNAVPVMKLDASDAR